MYQRRSRSYGSGSFRSPRRPPNRYNRYNRKKRDLDPSLFVSKAKAEEVKPYVPKYSFKDFALSDQLKRNIEAKGYQKPTPIQDQAIPHLIDNRDVIGMAGTGTGKTVAFLLPLIDKIYQRRNEKALIIAPTRELAVQIEDEFRSFVFKLNLFSTTCIGGMPIGRQIANIRRNPNFIIGTPGRLKDLEKRRILNFQNFSSIVLDEVDRMLDMGFLPDVKHLISRLPVQRQSLFFSATLPDKMQSLVQGFVKDPVKIMIQTGNASKNVDQDIVRVNGQDKIDVLHNLLIQKGFDKVLIFGQTKRGIEKLVRNLNDRGLKAASIHGNKSQSQRQRALDQFKRNSVKILLATDIASRGLDIDRVTHVINYDLPESYEDYIHRIGRTGRIDRKGTALTFVE